MTSQPRSPAPRAPDAAASPLRILHVIWWGEIGGIALNLVDLARHCGALNHSMEICVLARSSGLIDSLSGQNIRVTEFRARSGLDLPAFVRFYRFLRRERFDIIHDHAGNYVAALALLAGAGQARTIHQEHGAINVPRLQARKRLFYKVFGSRYDRFIAVSGKTAADMIRAGVAPGRITTIPNPVDPVQFSPDQSRREAKRIIGVPETALTVGTACRFVKEKDLDLFLQVARIIATKRMKIVFVMVGGGEEYETLRRRARDHGILPSVHFTGPRTDMTTVWRAFDVYLFTSRIEPFGRTLLESLACETPVVAAVPVTGGGIDVVRESPGILSVEDRTPDRLADATLRLLDSPALRTETGRHGRRWVIEKYHVAQWVGRLDDLYRIRSEPEA